MTTDTAPAARATDRDPARVAAARRATAVAFVAAGFVLASWLSRLPQIRSTLRLSAADLGLALLCAAVGSLLALAAAPVLVRRFGTRTVVSLMTVLAAVALTVVAVGHHTGTAPVVTGLVLLGSSVGTWNVAMNLQGALVERQAGRAVMPRLHAGFSIGTVASAMLGAGLVAIGVPVAVHLSAVALVVTVVVLLAVRSFLDDDDGAGLPVDQPRGRRLDRRTLCIGVVVVAFAGAEGAGNDWIAIALVDDHRTSPAVASLGYAAFLGAITVGRWTGPRLLDRHGRVAAIRGLAVVALLGLLLFVLSPWPLLALGGVLLWGLGACLGYPVALSAAADDPRLAAARVSTVSGIGQLAFLGGPPLLGLLGTTWTVQHALVVVPVLVALALPATSALAHPGRD
ncbi:MFS transporter [Nocardioides aurantiacus]|uniref:MFS transporter n=1 Tax=Nocardioides aurantiacus TaxID=86796 RepID=UPI00403FA488